MDLLVSLYHIPQILSRGGSCFFVHIIKFGEADPKNYHAVFLTSPGGYAIMTEESEHDSNSSEKTETWI